MSRRGENIYKRKDGRWEGRYIKYYNASGKAKYGYLYAHSYLQIKEKMIKAKTYAHNSTLDSNQDKTVSQLCELWLNDIKMHIKPSSYAKYHNVVYKHIVPKMGEKKICKLNDCDLQKFVADKLFLGRTDHSGGLSSKTVSDIVSVMKLIIKYGKNIGIKCFVNFSSIKIKKERPEINILNSNQCAIITRYLIDNISTINLGVLICLYTGLRIGEVCALRYEDISIADRVIHIRKTMQRIQIFQTDENAKTQITVTTPKSRCSVRDIPLPEFIAEIMIKGKFANSKNAYLLSGDDKKFIEPRTMQNRFKYITKQCGIDNINFHALRHSFATHGVEAGIDTKSLSEILGHSNVNITLNRYVHSSMEQKRINMEKLLNLIDYKPSIL